jgi:hypothetical protein
MDHTELSKSKTNNKPQQQEENLLNKSFCYADSLNSSYHIGLKNNSSFVSLIDAAIMYFNQTSPISDHVYTLQKQIIQQQIQNNLNEKLKLQANYENILKKTEDIKNKIDTQQINIENSTRTVCDLNEINKNKESELKKIEIEIKSLNDRNNNSFIGKHFNKKHISEYSKITEESYGSSFKSSDELDGPTRFNTYN